MISTKKLHIAPTMADFDDWQSELAAAISDIHTLFELLNLPTPHTPYAPKKFPLRVPHAFIAKMQQGDMNDPLLQQVLPDIRETLPILGYDTDPLAENHHNPIKGLLHKYRSRVLLTVTGACAVHCRYCFRQHFDYAANQPSTHEIEHVVNYIHQHPEIDEVLLSGGDPLSLNNKRLALWLDKLSGIAHISTIRLHTRLPVVLPNRIDEPLLQLFANCQKRLVMVLHINHPNEIDDAFIAKCQKLKDAGVILLNQTVLLSGINDNADTLTRLSHALFDAGILPYYLHILDKVQGAAHFDLSIEQAAAIYWQLLELLPGYLVPKLVQELPNRPFKTPIDIHRYVDWQKFDQKSNH
ncbi:EF-P beta-lysylation protein EpmB [Moraxella marmotae]|uniref:EF-P beta-lysylation protein EpmB n=1 Tax=Moraxella marmotae TaxID=3344520 RepID=UPI0035F252DC